MLILILTSAYISEYRSELTHDKGWQTLDHADLVLGQAHLSLLIPHALFPNKKSMVRWSLKFKFH